MDEWTFYLAAIPAVIMLGLSKGGFNALGGLATPILALAPGMSPVRAAAILLPLLVVGDWVSVWAFRKEFSGRNLAILIPGGVAGVGLGWLTAAYVNEEMIRLAVGMVSIGFVIFMLLRERIAKGAASEANVAPGLFWGTVGGFTSFISHSGSPPFQVYVLPQRLAPTVFTGTATMFFATVNALKLTPYFLLGQFKADNLRQSALLAPVALVATVAGIWLVRRISADRFYGIILFMSFALGVWLVYDALRGLGVIAF